MPVTETHEAGNDGIALSRESLGERATDRIRALIRSGDLQPGTRLVETELAERLRVSRGPVREALRNLEREGLVIITPSKRAMVTEWNERDLLNLYDLRTPLELKAMELTTERAATACVAELGVLLTAWQEAAKAGERERCADLDFEFHRVIWRHAGNPRLYDLLEQVIRPIETVFYLNATRYDDLHAVVALHRQVREAVASGEPAVARAAMEAHMENSLAKARRHSEGIAE